MSYRLELRLIGLPKRINQMSGTHWAVRAREATKWKARLAGKMILTRQSPPPAPLQRAKVTLVRHSSRCPDYDGLVVSFKPVMDALVTALVIRDDSMAVIGQPTYEWKPAAKLGGFVTILVEEVPEISKNSA